VTGEKPLMDPSMLDRIARERDRLDHQGAIKGPEDRRPSFSEEDFLTSVGLKYLLTEDRPHIRARALYGTLLKKTENKRYETGFFLFVSAKSLSPTETDERIVS
jgi:hypothetical protein